MHMSDALITPIVGGAMLASSLGVMSRAAKKIDYETIERKIPYMGLVGAFVFASQMINFAIPGTGSSGHIGGGMLLAILLGPHAGFLTMASVLLVQALFFADGGLLAYGCNLFNLGFFTCYVAYPLIYKPMMKKISHISRNRLIVGTVIASIVGLQLGSFAVVIQTVLSGRTDLPFMAFTAFMQPIHLAIGLVEGVITAMIIAYIHENRPDLIYNGFSSNENIHKEKKSYSKVLRGLAIATIVIGVLLSQFASSSPDGLEWAIENVSAEEMEAGPFDDLQTSFAILPDYDFSNGSELGLSSSLGTGVSGIAGSIITLLSVMGIGLVIRKRTTRTLGDSPTYDKANK